MKSLNELLKKIEQRTGIRINDNEFVVPVTAIEGWKEIIDSYKKNYGENNVSIKNEYITILVNKSS